MRETIPFIHLSACVIGLGSLEGIRQIWISQISKYLLRRWNADAEHTYLRHTAGRSSATGFWDTHTHTYFCTLACEQLTFLEEDVERERIVAEADRCQKMQQVKEFKKNLLYSFLLGLRCFRGRLSRLGQTWSTVARKSQQCVFERLAKSASDLSSYRHDSVPFST